MNEKRENNAIPLRLLIGHCTKVLVGCLVMMWGVINLVHNFLMWRATTDETSSGWLIILFVILTGVIPTVMGIWLLVKSNPPKASAH